MADVNSKDTKRDGHRAEWRSILDDPDVVRWHRGFGSENTADERGRILYRYCVIHITTPSKLASKAQDGNAGRRAVRDQLEDFCSRLLLPHKPSDHREDDGDPTSVETCGRGHRRGYVDNYAKAVRSFVQSLDVELGKLRLGRGADEMEKGESEGDVENEHVPTQAEMPAILSTATMRGRVCVALVGFATLRPETLGSRKAKNGLVLADLPDVKVLPGNREHPRGVVSIARKPTLVKVRKELSKVRRKYVVFLIGEGCGHLQAYLQDRVDHGETLGPSSPIVVPGPGFDRKGRPDGLRGSCFLTTQAISKDIRDAIRGAGLRCRPYALRKYGAGALQSACRAGKLTELDREFFLGRKGAITLVYTHHHELPEEKVEELRGAFNAAAPYLSERASRPVQQEGAEAFAHKFVGWMESLAKSEGDNVKMGDIAEEFERVGAEIRALLKAQSGERSVSRRAT